MLEGLTCVYRSNVDLFFYVVGSAQENEVCSSSFLNFDIQQMMLSLELITLHYITVFIARPTTTQVGLAVQMSTMMLKTRSVNEAP